MQAAFSAAKQREYMAVKKAHRRVIPSVCSLLCIEFIHYAPYGWVQCVPVESVGADSIRPYC